MTPCERKILTALMRVMALGLEHISNQELKAVYDELEEGRYVPDTFWTVERFGAAVLLIHGMRGRDCPKRVGRKLLRAIEKHLDPSWKLPHPFTGMKVPVKKHFEAFRRVHS